MFEALIKFKEAFSTQLADMASSQEALITDIQQQAYNTIQLRDSFSKFEAGQAQISSQLEYLSYPVQSRSSVSISTQTSSSHPEPLSNPVVVPSSTSTTSQTAANHIPSPTSTSFFLPETHPPSGISSVPRMEPSVKPQHSSKPSTPATPSIDRLPSSKRHKVLFIADSIGRNADVRHLEEATNTLIFTEKAYGAQYKTDALKPNKNFCYVSANVANKRDYKYAVLQGASTWILLTTMKLISLSYS